MNEDKCTVCGLTKSKTKSGSLTQYLTSCNCDNFDVYIPKNYETCSKCGKQIRKEKSGSITQYIFSASTCRCDAPIPSTSVMSGGSEFKSQAFAGFAEVEDEIELEVNQDSFPVERYKPLKHLGKGAGGSVYLSRDKLLKKLVTVKTLAVLTPDQLIQFQEEAKANNKLNHKNIVGIIDFGATESGSPYMVLEYFPGISLEKVLKEHGAFEWEVAVNIATEVSKALAYTHGQGIYHRDIKPSNILISFDEDQESEVKLIDFGIAKVAELTMSNLEEQGTTMAGTPTYMSPDTSMGNKYNASSEVYSLGCVLFEVLAGSPPFSGETALETISLHVHHSAPSLTEHTDAEIPDRLQAIISKCLNKKQSQRYRSMDELAKAFESLISLEHEDQDGAIFDASPLEQRSKEYERPLLIVAGMLALILGSWFAYAYLESRFKVENPAAMKHQSSGDDFEDKIAMNTVYQSSLDNVYMKPNNKGGPHDYVITGRLLGNEKLLRNTIENHKGRIESLEFLSDNLEGNALEYISTMPLLGLNILDCKVDEKTFELVGRIKTLRSLRFLECSGLKDQKLEFLQNLPDLIQLNLKRTDVADNALQNALSLSQLQVLDVSSCPNLKGTFLKDLRKLKKLHALLIANIKLDKESFQNIQKIKSLRLLELSEVPKDAVKIISKMKLTTLKIVDSESLDDKTLKEIAKISSIKEIDLNECKRITESTKLYLKSKYPEKKITHRARTSLTRSILEQEHERFQFDQ